MLMRRGHPLFLQIFLLSTFSLIFRTIRCSNTQEGVTLVKTIATSIKLNTATINATMTPNVSRTTNATSSINPTKASLTTSYVSTSVTTPKPLPTTRVPGSTGRKFDGLSFFGGMILGATICVILFFSIKYYQAKKRSYHSL